MARITIRNSCKVKPDLPESHGKSMKSFIQLGAGCNTGDYQRQVKLTKAKSRPQSNLAKLHICQNVNLRYIWIAFFCISQSNARNYEPIKSPKTVT